MEQVFVFDEQPEKLGFGNQVQARWLGIKGVGTECGAVTAYKHQASYRSTSYGPKETSGRLLLCRGAARRTCHSLHEQNLRAVELTHRGHTCRSIEPRRRPLPSPSLPFAGRVSTVSILFFGGGVVLDSELFLVPIKHSTEPLWLFIAFGVDR